MRRAVRRARAGLACPLCDRHAVRMYVRGYFRGLCVECVAAHTA